MLGEQIFTKMDFILIHVHGVPGTTFYRDSFMLLVVLVHAVFFYNNTM